MEKYEYNPSRIVDETWKNADDIIIGLVVLAGLGGLIGANRLAGHWQTDKRPAIEEKVNQEALRGNNVIKGDITQGKFEIYNPETGGLIFTGETLKGRKVAK